MLSVVQFISRRMWRLASMAALIGMLVQVAHASKTEF